jgi:hypothetical protein
MRQVLDDRQAVEMESEPESRSSNDSVPDILNERAHLRLLNRLIQREARQMEQNRARNRHSDRHPELRPDGPHTISREAGGRQSNADFRVAREARRGRETVSRNSMLFVFM